mgnify:CR=1 FL=1
MPVLKGKNLVKIKQQNMESIKMTLYQSAPISRGEIAERLDLTPPTITNMVLELIREGVVEELKGDNKKQAGQGAGRKPVNIDLVAESRLAMGISLGRDCTRYCITNLRGKVHVMGHVDVFSDDYEIMIGEFQSLLNMLKNSYPSEWEKLLGIGISVPGIVDSENGILKTLATERVNWYGRPMADDVSKMANLPVVLENNVRARATIISLFKPELLADDKTFALCHVSWGIACPIILRNQSLIGSDFASGEIGKMILDPNGVKVPHCGLPGSLESSSSIRGILELCRQAMKSGVDTELNQLCSNPDTLSLEEVLVAQNHGDKTVCEIMDNAMRFLGIALANVVGVINPHRIFLGGRVFQNYRNFEVAESSLMAHAYRASDEKLEVSFIDLGEYGGAVGAAARCIERYFIKG